MKVQGLLVISCVCACATVLTLAAGAQPQDKAVPAAKPAVKDEAKTQKAEADRLGDPYPLSTCPISGGKLGSMGDPVFKQYDGREVRFCCNACPPKFEKDLAKSMAKLDEAIIKDQMSVYPTDMSVVTGKKLPEKPVDFVFAHRLVRVVDESEKVEFFKDSAKHLAALDQAVIAKQGSDYPLTTCPVSGEKLGSMGAPKDVIVAGRLVRLCCSACKKDIKSQPAKFAAMMDDARKTPSKAGGDAPKALEEKGK